MLDEKQMYDSMGHSCTAFVSKEDSSLDKVNVKILVPGEYRSKGLSNEAFIATCNMQLKRGDLLYWEALSRMYQVTDSKKDQTIILQKYTTS